MFKKVFYISFFIVVLGFSILAQINESKPQQNCPKLMVIPPPSAVRVGESMTFSVNVSGKMNLDNISFKWLVDKGSITSGQGTAQIIVATGGLANTTVIATIEVLGIKDCKLSASDAGIVYSGGHYYLIDEFGPLANDDIKARIDNVIISLQNTPDMNAYVFNYGSDKKIHKRLKRFKSHIKFRKYDENRFVFINAGKEKEIRTKIYILPEGTDVKWFKE